MNRFFKQTEKEMPKVTMRFDADRVNFNRKSVSMLGEAVRNLVAEAASTAEVVLRPFEDIDFIPQPYPLGTQVAAPISFEIETIGYPARREKLTNELLEVLKGEFLKLIQTQGAHTEHITDASLGIWVKFTEGPHV